jgi:hypothetical protein
MFKSDRAAKRAIVILGVFFLIAAVAGFRAGDFPDVVLMLGLVLIFTWHYLNPWIMQEDYHLFMFLDHKRMRHNAFVIVGLLVLTSSVVMRLW